MKRELVASGALPGTYLGGLCRRGHDHHGSGSSLRYTVAQDCVQCVLGKNAAWARRHPEARAHHVALWRERHPDEARARGAAYSAAPEAKQRAKDWARGHRDELAATQRRFRKTERGRQAIRLGHNRRRARLASAPRVAYTTRDLTALFARYQGLCAYCGNSVVGVDHAVPLARGGHDALYNLVPCCACCNSSKHDRYVDEWYPRQVFFTWERLAFMGRTRGLAWTGTRATTA